ncbi:hypothetical protein [Tindallia californiensis]|uniref:Uncharacterized protein n=1 Tax=Tindallia californiensis TaxID=159292 RepID=A0A1H3LB56_9FIRM|nr:hypothetical protein [Tindallia californiensis]SDY61807.1 hypothetical protein SAMN05192546_103150 [Tindallia californiensis]
MSVNQISSYNTNEMLIQNLMKVKDVSHEKEMMGAISTAMDSVSLSFVGKNFADYHETLRSEGSQEALEGLRQMAIHLTETPNSQLAMDFSNIMQTRQAEEGFLTNFFTAVHEIEDSGNRMGTWLKTFSSLDTASNQDGFINTTRDILSMEGEREDLSKIFNDFVNTTGTIINKFEDEALRQETLEDFFTGLSGRETLEAYGEGIKNFRENME